MTTSRMELASRGRRLLAYLLDMLPIVMIVAAFFYLFLDLDQVWREYWKDTQNPVARGEFLYQRNWIRNITFVLWIVYCIGMEGSAYQGTLGKYLTGIKVIDDCGNPITPVIALKRNLTKFVSIAAFGLGFIWILFDGKNQGWHDKIQRTYVVKRR